MNDNPRASDDHIRLGLFLVLTALAFLLLTSVGAITIGAAFLVAWFFGRPALLALIASVIGAVSILILVQTSGFWIFLHESFIAYAVALQQTSYIRATAGRWVIYAINPSAWLNLSPLAMVAGAACILLLEDHKISRRRKVSGDHAVPQPSPWARLMIRRILRGPAIYRDALVIGANALTGKRIVLTEHELNRATVCVGRSGAGKTTTILNFVEYAVSRGIPVLMIDHKGDRSLGETICRLARENGRPSYLFDAQDTDTSCFYNPLTARNYTARADCIVGLRDNWTEEHYKLLATEQIQTTFRVLEYLGIESDLVQLPHFMTSQVLLALVRSRGLRGSEYQTLANDIMKMKENEKAGIGSLRASITNLTTASFGPLFDLALARELNKPILELPTARREGAVVYFGLSALVFPETSKRFFALISNDLKNALAAQNTPWLNIFDECSSMGPQVINIVNQGRTYGCLAVLGTQSFSDFILPSHPQFVRQVVASANAFIFHDLTDPEDAELAARIIGTSLTVGQTSQMVGDSATGVSSAREVREFRVHPDDLKSSATGEAYVLNKSRKEIFLHTKIRRGNF